MHINYTKKMEANTVPASPEETVDDIFAQVVSGMFENLWISSEFGPRDFLITFSLDKVGYDALRKDARGGLEWFQDRVCDVLEAVVKDLVIFNGIPTTAATRITTICDATEITDNHECPCWISIGLRQEED